MSRGTDWPEHISNGGTAVARLPPASTTSAPVIESVQLFMDPSIFLKGDELHTSRQKPADLSDFWEFHWKRVERGSS